MQNEAHYDLDRKANTISALYSNNFDIYKYLTGEDKQARFEYSPLSKLLNKGLKEEQKKEGQNEQQLKAIKDQGNKQLNAKILV